MSLCYIPCVLVSHEHEIRSQNNSIVNLNKTTSLSSYFNQTESWTIKVCNKAERGVQVDGRQHSLASKSLVTSLAGKRLFLCMDMHMSFQVFHARENPLTEGALCSSDIIWGGGRLVHRADNK